MKFDKILLDFSDDKSDEKIYWTLRDAFQGVQIFGGIGSGKTSGSGQTLARAFLKNGFGGLVLCAKPSEREDWEKLAKKEGREKDLKIFCVPQTDSEIEYFFNPLDYEATRLGGGDTFNLVNLFMQIYQMGRIVSGEGLASGGERFWDNAMKRLLNRMIDLLKIANEPITINNMYRLVSEAPSAKEIEYLTEIRNRDDQEEAKIELEQWANLNFYIHCYRNSLLIPKQHESNVEFVEERKKQIHVVRNYFEREFANIAEKTKTIIVESFLGLAEPFQSGILEKYFSGESTIYPEETFEKSKIIILDFPIKNYLEAGIYAQGLFKLLWQQSVERRKYEEGDIPVFLWVDEAHNFLSNYDQIFQTTARSAGVSTVFISQNISNYYVAIGGNNSASRVDSLLGNLSTKIFHNNNDYVTNEWASKLIGKSWQDIPSFNVGETQSFSMNQQYHWNYAPDEFARLKTGGKELGGIVEAVIVASKELSKERNFIVREFRQNKI